MDAKKPDDWLDDEPNTIADPGLCFMLHARTYRITNPHIDASKPEEWDDEEDGDYIAPTIPNPKCDAVSGCGEWKRCVVN
jgi:hypothetical protein